MAVSAPPVTVSTAHRAEMREPVSDKVQRIAYAVGILFPVLAFGVARAFAPPIKDGAAAQIAYSAAHPALHQIEQVAFPLVCVLSLLGIIGLTRLAIHRSPWLAMTGGVLALAGWGTLPIWAGQDNLTYLMGRMGASPQLAELWKQFNTSGTNTYLYIFIVGHLVGPLLLGIALVRARMIPLWSPIVIAVSIPLHILAFVIGTRYLDPIAYAMLAAAFIPAVVVTLRSPQSGARPALPPSRSISPGD
jgi:hypothetical protein